MLELLKCFELLELFNLPKCLELLELLELPKCLELLEFLPVLVVVVVLGASNE